MIVIGTGIPVRRNRDHKFKLKFDAFLAAYLTDSALRVSAAVLSQKKQRSRSMKYLNPWLR